MIDLNQCAIQNKHNIEQHKTTPGAKILFANFHNLLTQNNVPR